MRARAGTGRRYVEALQRRMASGLRAPFCPTPLGRFFSHVEQTSDGCWEWTGSRRRRGYGVHYIHRRPIAAYRYAYALFFGEPDSSLVTDHLCRNPSCVNPTHLEMVTSRENILRGVGPSARQARQTHCKQGHLLGPAGPNRKRNCKVCQADWQRNKRATRMAQSCGSCGGTGLVTAGDEWRPCSKCGTPSDEATLIRKRAEANRADVLRGERSTYDGEVIRR